LLGVTGDLNLVQIKGAVAPRVYSIIQFKAALPVGILENSLALISIIRLSTNKMAVHVWIFQEKFTH
jgi:hypothetical protein